MPEDNLSVPNHGRVPTAPEQPRDRWFPLLPPQLIDLIASAPGAAVKRATPPPLDTTASDKERRYANSFAGIKYCVGINDGVPVVSPLLFPLEAVDSTSDSAAASLLNDVKDLGLGWDPHALLAVFGRLAEVKSREDPSRAGMAAFVLLQERFHREYQNLRELLQASFGLSATTVRCLPIVQMVHSSVDAELDTGHAAMDAFCRAWRIRSMPAPYIFEFDGSLDAMPAEVVQNLRPGAVVSHRPPGIAVPSRAQARDSLRAGQYDGDTAERFADWDNIVAADTQHNRTRDRYAKLYPIQHFYRVLADRHPAVEQRNIQRVLKSVMSYVTCEPVSRSTLDEYRQDVAKVRKLVRQYDGHQSSPLTLSDPD